MSDPLQVATVAEGQSDADVIVALVEMLVRTEGPQWLREQLADLGSLDHLATFVRPALTWVRVKGRGDELRIRIRRRGDGPFVTEIRKALAVLDQDAPGALAILHRDHDAVDRREVPRALDACANLDREVVLALPDPATQAWVLQAAGHPVPSTTEEARGAVGRAGLTEPHAALEAVRASRPEAFDEQHGGARVLVELRARIVSRLAGH